MFSIMATISQKVGSFFTDLMETVVISASIFLIVYLFFLQPHQVNGQSMVPNFQNGEYVLTDKISYKIGNPKRGDIVVFHAPEAAHCAQGTGCDFIKRILAVPGDTLEVKNNAIYVNGKQLPEPYIPADFKVLPGNYTKNGPVVMGPNNYFASGDNRPYSSDSRTWGPITKQDIVGKVFFRYWPPAVMGPIHSATYSNF
ncbi:MAG: signal peptidase I [Candidatus Pacebacteria bacterium CG10_big_fil_rev_8_21_14_0_10_36_11]|nr:MAG: signal peptidase I [Candidatus Pacebacteria bacterium CG10_big_fil_rev_8_21_14_0_10_36_11]PJC42367.1 MAG: signal peptidase I [Candidatus Pacebacteria bacterium CG_4_9_14_0_2_um_filter_36_8]